MAEQPSLVGRRERGAARELERPADVVHERRREHELAAQPRVELRRLAAERRDPDGVLEQAARVGVVVVRRGRKGREVAVGEHRAHRRAEPGMRDLADQELEEALQLRRRRGGSPASGWPGRRRPPRASARRAGAGRGTSRRGRARARRRPRRSGRRAARRRSRRARRCVPIGSTSSSARYGAPPFVRSFRFVLTAKTPSTTRSSARSEITRASLRLASGRVPRSRRFARSATTRRSPGPLDDLVAPPYDVIDDDAARATSGTRARTTSST